MFNKTLNMIPNGVLLFDIQSKLITFANKEMQEMLDLDDQVTNPNFFLNLQQRV